MISPSRVSSASKCPPAPPVLRTVATTSMGSPGWISPVGRLDVERADLEPGRGDVRDVQRHDGIAQAHVVVAGAPASNRKTSPTWTLPAAA